MRITESFFKYLFILLFSCSISVQQLAAEAVPENSSVFNALIETISSLLFEYTKRLTPTDNLIYLVVYEPDTQFKHVKELVEYGANPNACIGDTEETLLQRAIDSKKSNIAQALVESGAAITYISKQNITEIFKDY